MGDGQESPEEFPSKENSSIQYISIDEAIELSKSARLELAKRIWGLYPFLY